MNNNILVETFPDEIIERIFYFLKPKQLRKMKNIHSELYRISLSKMVLNNVPIEMVKQLDAFQKKKYMEYGNYIYITDVYEEPPTKNNIIFFIDNFSETLKLKILREKFDGDNAKIFSYIFLSEYTDSNWVFNYLCGENVYPFNAKTLIKQSIKKCFLTDSQYMICFCWVCEVLISELQCVNPRDIIFCILLFNWVLNIMGAKIRKCHYQLILISCMQIMAKVYGYDKKFSTDVMNYYAANAYSHSTISFSYALILSLQPPAWHVDLNQNFGTNEIPLYLKHIPNDWRKFHIITPDYVRKGEIVFDGRPLPEHTTLKELLSTPEYNSFLYKC